MTTDVIEREEWLIALGIFGDIRAELEKLVGVYSEDPTMKKRKRTSEEIEAWRQYRREAGERLRRASELVAKGLAEVDAKRSQEQANRRLESS